MPLKDDLETLARRAAIEVLFNPGRKVNLGITLNYKSDGEENTYSIVSSTCGFPREERKQGTIQKPETREKVQGYIAEIEENWRLVGIEFGKTQPGKLFSDKTTYRLPADGKSVRGKNYGRGQVEKILSITRKEAEKSQVYQRKQQYTLNEIALILEQTIPDTPDPQAVVYGGLLAYKKRNK